MVAVNLGKFSTCFTIAFLAFRHGLDAAGAQILAHFATIFVEGDALDVGLKLPLRLALRETDVMSRQRPLATYFTFSHNFTLP